MASFGFYTDSALTQPVSSNVQVGSGSNDFRFYLGSVSDSYKLQDASSPGVNAMELEIVDANIGTGPEGSWVKLALTQSGLDTAVEGAALEIGTTVFGGVSTALPFWVRINNGLSGAVSSTDLSIKVVDAKEFSV